MNETHAVLTGISSMATRQMLADFASAFEARYGQRVAIESVGGVDARKRIEKGEAFDFVVLAQDAIDRLAASGHVDPASCACIARSGIAVAVAEGGLYPDIDDENAVREAVLAARSIGYSTGPSGVHVTCLFERWDIATKIASRVVQAPPGVAVGSLIAQGRVELGFQQLSELIDVPGIDIVGMLPSAIQTMTEFKAAVCAQAHAPQAARAFLAFVTSARFNELKARHGMAPSELRRRVE